MIPLSLVEKCGMGVRLISLRKFLILFKNVTTIHGMSDILTSEYMQFSTSLCDLLTVVLNSIWMYRVYSLYKVSYGESQKIAITLEKNETINSVKSMASQAIGDAQPDRMKEMESLLVAPIQKLPSMVLVFQTMQKNLFHELLLKPNDSELKKCLQLTVRIIDKLKIVLGEVNSAQ